MYNLHIPQTRQYPGSGSIIFLYGSESVKIIRVRQDRTQFPVLNKSMFIFLLSPVNWDKLYSHLNSFQQLYKGTKQPITTVYEGTQQPTTTVCEGTQ